MSNIREDVNVNVVLSSLLHSSRSNHTKLSDSIVTSSDFALTESTNLATPSDETVISDKSKHTNDKYSKNCCSPDYTDLSHNHTITMGNQQTNKKTVQGEESPDETKTKCCQVPKKKVKERNKRASRSSRSDDLAFESDEVYPFDARTRSEQELHEPVELEPFDIVDTDDIRFVPGAGTSEVIKSVSEPKFTPIPEEVDGDEITDQKVVEGSENTTAKIFYIDRGSKIVEPGTATAHSTFEFKQVKTKKKTKLTKSASEPLYENMKDKTQTVVSSPSAEGALSKSPPNNSSKQSRKNSKEVIQKPLRKSKKGKTTGSSVDTDTTEVNEPVSSSSIPEEDNLKREKTKSKKSDKPAVRDSEIDRNIDSVLMLTQTMFSKIKKPDEQITLPFEQKGGQQISLDNAVEGKYENVNVCVKLEPTGLQIAHKEIKQLNEEGRKSKQSSSSQGTSVSDDKNNDSILPGGKYENVGVVAKIVKKGISIGHKNDKPDAVSKTGKGQEKKKPSSKQLEKGTKETDKKIKKRKASDDKEFVQISRNNSTTESLGPGILHVSDSGTLIIKADKSDNKDCIKICTDATPGASNDVVPALTESQNQTELQKPKGMLHISDSGTLIIHSLPKPPTHAPSSERGRSHYYENDIINRDITDVKIPFEETNRNFQKNDESKFLKKEQVSDKTKSGELESRNSESSVPPSSPNSMDMLEEVLEEEEEDIDDETFLEDERQTAEMVEFSENVCKRLSQLLESQKDETESHNGEENEDYLFESGAYENYENIYETLNRNIASPKNNTKEISSSFVSGEPSQTNLKAPIRNESSNTLKRASADSENQGAVKRCLSSSEDDDNDGMPEYFDPRESSSSTMEPKSSGNFESTYFSAKDSFRKDNQYYYEGIDSPQYECIDTNDRMSKELTLPIRPVESFSLENSKAHGNSSDDYYDKTPTTEMSSKMSVVPETSNANDSTLAQHDGQSGRRSVACTESDIDISEHRDDMSTDSMLADDEEEETMEILFTKTYTEPEEGAEVFLSCTVVNSAYKNEAKKSDTWLSDEALEYFEANASEVMSTAFMKAKKEMKDIQACLQNLRKQMEHFHGDRDDISLPDIPVDHLSPDYFGFSRKAITD